MKLYEVKLLTPENADAGTINEAAREVAEQMSSLFEVVSTTVHGRWPEKPVNRNHESALLLVVDDPEDMDEFAGRVTRQTGLIPLNYAEVGEGTLNLKGSDETIGELLEQEFETFK